MSKSSEVDDRDDASWTQAEPRTNPDTTRRDQTSLAAMAKSRSLRLKNDSNMKYLYSVAALILGKS